MYSFGKTVHFGTNTIANEIKSQGQCIKDVQLLSLVVQLFNGCTAFEKYIYEDHRICTALEKTFFLYQQHSVCIRYFVQKKTCTFTNRFFQYPKIMPGIN